MEKLTVSQCVSSDYCQGWNDSAQVCIDEHSDIHAKYKAVCAELEELQSSLPKIKADAIREAVKACGYDSNGIYGYEICESWDLHKYADKLEKAND